MSKNEKNKNHKDKSKDTSSNNNVNNQPGLFARILKEYPWPIQKHEQPGLSIQKREENTAEGNVMEGIGEFCSEGGFGFDDERYNILADILSDIELYTDDEDARPYISCLIGITLQEDYDMYSVLDELGISVITKKMYNKDGLFIGYDDQDEDDSSTGDDDEDDSIILWGIDNQFDLLEVESKLQDHLLEKLSVIYNRLKAFTRYYNTGELQVGDHRRLISDLIDVYGTNIPSSDLVSLTKAKRPPVGYLTTKLLISWQKSKAKLFSSRSPDGFGPTNDYLFLKWLVNGRQKKIITYLERHKEEDNEIAEIYNYLIKMAGEYVNEKRPVFGGPYNGVLIRRYEYNKELYSGFLTNQNSKEQEADPMVGGPKETLRLVYGQQNSRNKNSKK